MCTSWPTSTTIGCCLRWVLLVKPCDVLLHGLLCGIRLCRCCRGMLLLLLLLCWQSWHTWWDPTCT
jgi:hypothetical protein